MRKAGLRRVPRGWWPLVALLLGTLLAPPAFWLGRALVHSGWLPQLGPFAFPTYLRRVWLVAVLACAPLWLRPAGLWGYLRAAPLVQGERPVHHPNRSDWLAELHPGAAPQPRLRAGSRAVQLAGGFALGTVGTASLAAGLLRAKWLVRGAPLSVTHWLVVLLGSLVSAALVAGLEEAVFRGALLQTCSRRLGPWRGAFVSVLMFVAVHFVALPARGPVNEDVRWYAGFEVLATMLQPLLEPHAHAASFCTLLAVGGALTLAARRGRSVWWPMGIHAAWVFGLRLVAQSCVRLRPADWWLDRELRAGLLPTLLALGTALVLCLLPAAALRGRAPQG